MCDVTQYTCIRLEKGPSHYSLEKRASMNRFTPTKLKDVDRSRSPSQDSKPSQDIDLIRTSDDLPSSRESTPRVCFCAYISYL